MAEGEIEQAASDAGKLLATVAPGAVCVAQAWDDRIDCLLKLPDGTVIGEMIPFRAFSEARIGATGERLRRRAEGVDVPLVDELRPAIRICEAPR